MAGIAQGLERLTVAQEAVGSRPITRPILFRIKLSVESGKLIVALDVCRLRLKSFRSHGHRSLPANSQRKGTADAILREHGNATTVPFRDTNGLG